jgi:hypothetical protein
MQQMAGAHKKLYQRWRTDLIQVCLCVCARAPPETLNPKP